MINIKKDWEFNVLGVYNYKTPGRFDEFFDFIKNKHDKIEGDIVEAGVYKGSSLLAIAIFLKEIGSNKKIYGFDSFAGFPPVFHEKDDLSEFERMADRGEISSEHINSVRKNILWKKELSNKKLHRNISTSGAFSDTSKELLLKKIELIGLDNIVLVDGPFSETMNNEATVKNVMGVVIDCDLYQSYLDSFNFVWPRLSVGGMIHLDEYFSLKFPGGKLATDEFVKSVDAKLIMSKQKEGDFERWHLIKQK